jgi:hypothetical protein
MQKKKWKCSSFFCLYFIIILSLHFSTSPFSCWHISLFTHFDPRDRFASHDTEMVGPSCWLFGTCFNRLIVRINIKCLMLILNNKCPFHLLDWNKCKQTWTILRNLFCNVMHFVIPIGICFKYACLQEPTMTTDFINFVSDRSCCLMRHYPFHKMETI